MTELNFNWVENESRFGSGELLILNGIRVASYSWNAMRSGDSKKDKSLDQSGHVLLPGLADKAKKVYGETPEQVKITIEGVVTRWFNRALAPKE